MKFAVRDRVKLKVDMFEGRLPKGTQGVIREAFGVVSYRVKFDGFARIIRVLESQLTRA